MVVALTGSAAARAADLPWLRTDGTRIVDEAGKTVTLRGANLGGWLVEEMWLMPFQTKPPEGSGLAEVKDHVSLWRTIEGRLGAAERDRIRTALREAWIAEADFDRVRDAGMNHVRVPFIFDMLEEPDGFSWLDKALERAKARGLYVVLDLHGTPGRQSGEHHTGEAGVDRLFKDPASVARTEKVWAEVARRYRDRPEVAAYDLINEPMGAPDAAAVYRVQGRLLRAIRAVDPKHMIIVEDGYKGMDTLPRAGRSGWTNVVLSTHHYHFNAKSADDQIKAAEGFVSAATKIRKDRRAPYYVGEFQQEPHGSPATMARFIQGLDRAGHSWAVWAYKTAMKDGGGGMWGWHRRPKPLDALDPFRDSAADLLRKLDQVRTERLMEDAALTEAFRGEPVRSGK
jgi:hypothetical protein